jgi:hypothetical protein
MFQPSRMGGLFGLPGQRPPYQTPGIGDGMEQHHNLPQQAEAPRKGGIFAQGGVGRSIAGHIGDALLQMNRMQPIYSEAIAAQRLMQQRQKLAEQQRQWGREDKQWEWGNKPQEPETDTFTRALAGANIAPGSPEYLRLMRQRADALANPVQWITGDDGIPRPMPRSMGDAPDTLPPDFFGAGGPTQPASDTFQTAFRDGF